MRADRVELSWDPGKSNWLLRIVTGEEVIRRHCSLPKTPTSRRFVPPPPKPCATRATSPTSPPSTSTAETFPPVVPSDGRANQPRPSRGTLRSVFAAGLCF